MITLTAGRFIQFARNWKFVVKSFKGVRPATFNLTKGFISFVLLMVRIAGDDELN